MEPHEKANLLRILEYFKLRAIYTNTVFYANSHTEPYDLKKEFKSTQLNSFKIIKDARKKFGRVPKSKLPFSMLKELLTMFTKHWEKEHEIIKENKLKQQTTDDSSL